MYYSYLLYLIFVRFRLLQFRGSASIDIPRGYIRRQCKIRPVYRSLATRAQVETVQPYFGGQGFAAFCSGLFADDSRRCGSPVHTSTRCSRSQYH